MRLVMVKGVMLLSHAALGELQHTGSRLNVERLAALLRIPKRAMSYTITRVCELPAGDPVYHRNPKYFFGTSHGNGSDNRKSTAREILACGRHRRGKSQGPGTPRAIRHFCSVMAVMAVVVNVCYMNHLWLGSMGGSRVTSSIGNLYVPANICIALQLAPMVEIYIRTYLRYRVKSTTSHQGKTHHLG